MPYLIEHHDCQCRDTTPKTCGTAADVALYLWGRDVVQHLVWAGECPYQFWTPDVRLIQALLEDCPVQALRPFLPCSFWAGRQVLVVMGWRDEHARLPLRELSYMQWLWTHHPKETPYV